MKPARAIIRCMLITEDCLKFRRHIAWQSFLVQLYRFPGCCAGKSVKVILVMWHSVNTRAPPSWMPAKIPLFRYQLIWRSSACPSDQIQKSHSNSSGFFSWGGLGVPPSGKNFANPPPHLTLVSVFGPRLVPPQPRLVPENLKNLNTFLCQIWLLLSSKVP